jgi:protein gp37
MGEERLRRVIEYIDSRVKRLEEEISLLKGLREIMEDKVRRLSVEPLMEEVPAILSSEVKWRSYPNGEGEWCFADELPKSFIDELRRKAVMDLDGYRYVYKRLSGGKEIVARRMR